MTSKTQIKHRKHTKLVLQGIRRKIAESRLQSIEQLIKQYPRLKDTIERFEKEIERCL